MIVDSHCHLDFSELFNQLDEVIHRAESNQVKCFLTICTTLESFERIKLIINKYKNIYGTFGIHPHETKKFRNVDSKFILDLKKKYEKVIGIGETGLDFYYNHSDKKIQIKSFIEHIHAASELNIPIIVHSRNAEIDTYEIIKSEIKNSNLKVLIHCFTGSTTFAKKLIDIDCYISVSGIITFKNSIELTKTISLIPNVLAEAKPISKYPVWLIELYAKSLFKFFCTIAAIPPTNIDAIDKKIIICLHSSINKIKGSKQNLYIKAIPANFGTIAKNPVIAVGAPS